MSTPSNARVASEQETQDVAVRFVQQLVGYPNRPLVVYLSGDLGAGKSVFARSVLQVLGVSVAIKSPTYTLVEQYALHSGEQSSDQRLGPDLSLAAHLDLYRLVDPEELYFIGFDEIATSCDLLLIEWPDKGVGQLPNATHTVMIDYPADAHSSEHSGALSGARDITIIEH